MTLSGSNTDWLFRRLTRKHGSVFFAFVFLTSLAFFAISRQQLFITADETDHDHEALLSPTHYCSWDYNDAAPAVNRIDRRRRLMSVSLPASSARLGNQMFGHAALLGLAYCLGYEPIMTTVSSSNELVLQIFSVTPRVVSRSLGSTNRWSERKPSSFTAPENMSKTDDPATSTVNVELFGYFQSWRYFAAIPHVVMANFQFKPNIRAAASRVIARLLRNTGILPTTSTGAFEDNESTSSTLILVGIHVRRSDMALAHHLQRGYRVADEKYFLRAMEYIEKQIATSLSSARLVYIVCTDETAWARANIVSDRFPVVHSDVLYGDSAVDLAILASCDHVITSTGSYSWWAGYLASTRHRLRGNQNSTVIYYANFPPPNTEIGSGFSPSDYYPPTWIGLT